MKQESICITMMAFAAALSTSSAFAATAQCVGLVKEVGNHVPGGLYVSVADSGHTKICDLNVVFFRTTPADCKQHLATAQLALATGKTVSLWVDNAPTTACASITTWGSSDLRYFSVIK